MRITADTNVLVRAIVEDDPAQARVAQDVLERAELVAVSIVALCELAWVLKRGYGVDRDEIASAIEGLTRSAKVACDRPAVEAGLAVVKAGGDFADGALAATGAALGGDAFATFDHDAARLLRARGRKVEAL